MQRFTNVTVVDPRVPFFYFYHPLTPVDQTAFNDINLDVGAYEFIENSIDLKKRLPAYYGT